MYGVSSMDLAAICVMASVAMTQMLIDKSVRLENERWLRLVSYMGKSHGVQVSHGSQINEERNFNINKIFTYFLLVKQKSFEVIFLVV